MDSLKIIPFSKIKLSDSFFDGLRNNYVDFDKWFIRKAEEGASAFAFYDLDGNLKDFLYVKLENEPIKYSEGVLPAVNRLKVGTFKIERRGTSRGERFMKKIFDIAIEKNVDEIYVTLFDDTDELIHLRKFFEKFGFVKCGEILHANSRRESILIRKMKVLSHDMTFSYPYIPKKSNDKYVLSIYPEYHTKLFPDAILRGENIDLISDISPTNSIYKIYICWMRDVKCLKSGDILCIYRTTDHQGPAAYRSVITSICTVDKIMSYGDFENVEAFIKYTNKYSIFDANDLRKWYITKPHFTVIKMLYNFSLNRKVIRKQLIEDLKFDYPYWGFFKITDKQFSELLNLGKANECYIID